MLKADVLVDVSLGCGGGGGDTLDSGGGSLEGLLASVELVVEEEEGSGNEDRKEEPLHVKGGGPVVDEDGLVEGSKGVTLVVVLAHEVHQQHQVVLLRLELLERRKAVLNRHRLVVVDGPVHGNSGEVLRDLGRLRGK